jgi:hypothetical protein
VVHPGPLCDNPQKTSLPMRLVRNLAAGLSVVALAWVVARPQAQAPAFQKNPVSNVLVLAGGTVVDVTEWGHSAKDIADAIVIVRDGRIGEVGPRFLVPIPKGARVIDCTGKFMIPGLVDGFAGMNSQGQANANLYMGVTTVVVSQRPRHGLIDSRQSPLRISMIDSVGVHRQLEPAGQAAGVGRQAQRGSAARRAEPRGHQSAT